MLARLGRMMLNLHGGDPKQLGELRPVVMRIASIVRAQRELQSKRGGGHHHSSSLPRQLFRVGHESLKLLRAIRAGGFEDGQRIIDGDAELSDVRGKRQHQPIFSQGKSCLDLFLLLLALLLYQQLEQVRYAAFGHERLVPIADRDVVEHVSDGGPRQGHQELRHGQQCRVDREVRRVGFGARRGLLDLFGTERLDPFHHRLNAVIEPLHEL